jgi:hypothetical protein
MGGVKGLCLVGATSGLPISGLGRVRSGDRLAEACLAGTHIAWARSAIWSLRKMLETWLRTVFWLTASLWAMVALPSPRATSPRTSRSRSVSAGNAGGWALERAAPHARRKSSEVQPFRAGG